ncbi:MAG TPA: hypothetical protein EYQ75_13555 [Planctomycetaceae bacterium]|nr:hypothetical protein [Planctomycetaceae bacterium]
MLSWRCRIVVSLRVGRRLTGRRLTGRRLTGRRLTGRRLTGRRLPGRLTPRHFGLRVPSRLSLLCTFRRSTVGRRRDRSPLGHIVRSFDVRTTDVVGDHFHHQRGFVFPRAGAESIG